MLYSLLLNSFQDQNLLFVLFRGVGAGITAFCLCLLTTFLFIRKANKSEAYHQPIRQEGPQSHIIKKQKIPTMGGAMMLFSILISTVIWANVFNGYVWMVLIVMLSFGALGLIDDLIKVFAKNTNGFRGSIKFVIQAVIIGGILLWLQFLDPVYQQNAITIPFTRHFLIPLGYLYVPFILAVVVGSGNAVNLTDGLDGLAIVPVMMAAFALAVISFIMGSGVLSSYIHLEHNEQFSELFILCITMIGAGTAFLWFNIHPAKIFMGDVGSLALGGMLGIMAVILRRELAFAIIGMLFVVETASVILQVGSYRLRGGKRIFLMAPIHHHFEKIGWGEEAVVVRFWIFALIFTLIGLMSAIVLF